MSFVLDTHRLHLTEFTYNDSGFLVELLNSPGWLQYIGDRNVHSQADAIAYLDNGPMKSYRENGFGLMRVDIKYDQKPIGMCGLLKRPELDCPDIGFALLPEYHRQGYAFEAASATITQARESLGIPQLLAMVQPDNADSISLLIKLGFTFEREIKSGVKLELLRLYSLTLQRPR